MKNVPHKAPHAVEIEPQGTTAPDPMPTMPNVPRALRGVFQRAESGGCRKAGGGMTAPACCQCGRLVTNEQAYGWDRKRRRWWCEDCADPLTPRQTARAAILEVLSRLGGLWGHAKI